MLAVLHLLGMFIVDLFKPRPRLEAENLFLRHQLAIALRRAPARLRLRGSDRALLVLMTRLWPSLLGATHVVQPETILRWHRAGFKAFWHWKSRNRVGRPKIDRGLRDLILLGFEVAQSTVSKYMVKGGSPSQSWKTFLRNHAQAIAAIDLCLVPTLSFDLLFAFLVLGHGRRQLLWFEVTRHPTTVAGSANHRGVSLELGASLPGARQRPRLRPRLHVSGEGNGYPRPPGLSCVTVAERLC
jgi:hypothetical protein